MHSDGYNIEEIVKYTGFGEAKLIKLIRVFDK